MVAHYGAVGAEPLVDPDTAAAFVGITGLRKSGENVQVLWNVVARDGVEPPTPAFSGLRSTT